MKNNETLLKTYKEAFPVACAFIRKNGGNLEDAKEYFHEAFVIYLEKKDQDVIVNPVTYLTGITKHLWFRHCRKERNQLSGPEWQNQEEAQPDGNKILELLRQQGKKCLDLLTAFYYDEMEMKEISRRFSFSNERSATVQKFKCLEKMRNLVKSKSIKKEYFYE